jgi:hypothetical protein
MDKKKPGVTFLLPPTFLAIVENGIKMALTLKNAKDIFTYLIFFIAAP